MLYRPFVPRVTSRTILYCEQLGERIVPDASAMMVPTGVAVATTAPDPEPVAPPAFKSIDEVTKELQKNPTAAAILKLYLDGGGKIEGKATQSGGGADIETLRRADGTVAGRTITIDPNSPEIAGLTGATSALLFELLRFKYEKEQIELSKQLRAGTITPKQFALKMEELGYKYVQEHHKIAAAAVADAKSGKPGWSPESDDYADLLERYPTWEDRAKDVEESEHYKDALKRAEKLAPKPKNPTPTGGEEANASPTLDEPTDGVYADHGDYLTRDNSFIRFSTVAV